MFRKTRNVAAAALAAMVLMACAGHETSSAVAEPTATRTAEQAGVAEFYEAYAHGRMHAFSNLDSFQGYLESGEAPLVQTMIGKGPGGSTVIFGLTKDESKLSPALPFIDLYLGDAEPAGPFYGETAKDGRFYVFDSWEDMSAFRESGEAPYVFTHIGKGPGRASVVIVRNKDSVKDAASADQLLARFISNHGA